MKKYNVKTQEDVEQSEWNFAVPFYNTLSELRRFYIYAIVDGDLQTAAKFVSNEIDWVSEDITKKILEKLRKNIDYVVKKLNNGNYNRKKIESQLNNIKRQLWDAEMRAGITRPKSNDMSEKSMVDFNRSK